MTSQMVLLEKLDVTSFLESCWLESRQLLYTGCSGFEKTLADKG